MSRFLRVIVGLVCLMIGAAVGNAAAVGFWFAVVFPRQQSREVYASFISINGVILEGWQPYAVFGILALLACFFMFLGAYALTHRRKSTKQ